VRVKDLRLGDQINQRQAGARAVECGKPFRMICRLIYRGTPALWWVASTLRAWACSGAAAQLHGDLGDQPRPVAHRQAARQRLVEGW